MSCCQRSHAAATATHALDPLTADEIALAVAALRARQEVGARAWIETVVLAEPDFEADPSLAGQLRVARPSRIAGASMGKKRWK